MYYSSKMYSSSSRAPYSTVERTEENSFYPRCHFVQRGSLPFALLFLLVLGHWSEATKKQCLGSLHYHQTWLAISNLQFANNCSNLSIFRPNSTGFDQFHHASPAVGRQHIASFITGRSLGRPIFNMVNPPKGRAAAINKFFSGRRVGRPICKLLYRLQVVSICIVPAHNGGNDRFSARLGILTILTIGFFVHGNHN
jgi:hypothetical protein